jgi:hypothetical protein
MKFVRASTRRDFDGTHQTIGLTPDGQIWLITGHAGTSEQGHASAQFEPREALRYARELITCALEGIRISEGQLTMDGYEQFPLRSQWGYDRYQTLADEMGIKQAMAQASREETEVFPCRGCGSPVRLSQSGEWVLADPGYFGTMLRFTGDDEIIPAIAECEHEPDITYPVGKDNDDDNRI